MEEHFHIEKDYFHPGFDIIPAGPVPNNASDLLTSSHLKTLIERLRSSYDYVLIDAMHVGQVADAVIIGQLADLSVFILRENCTDKSKITELADIYSEGTFKNMRVILNASSDRQFSESEMQKYLM
jgi:Mrp family chromosome partitioning ATPase